MSRLSKQIRAYVDDPDSTGRLHYGAWGILRRDQRRLIRQLCDECDAFEKAADEFHRKIKTNDWLTKGISEEQLEREKQEALDEFAERNGYCKVSDVAEQFKEIAKQYLLEKGLYLAVLRNALNHAEAELKKKYESEGAEDE